MYNISKYLKILELDKILKQLSNEATMPEAAEEILNILPTNDIDTVKNLLSQTEDAYLLTAKFSAPSFGRLCGVKALIARANAGGLLSMKELLTIFDALRVIRTVKGWKDNCDSEKQTSLDDLFSALYPNKYFEDKINNAIKSEDEMSDTASAALSDLRRKIKSVSANIKSKFDSITKDGSKSKYLQEGIVTQRDGRYVVPVKQEYKSYMPGIVHDTSASGATLFIEPMPIVELNNELRVLKTKEKLEIERILTELSAEVSTFGDAIYSSYIALIELNKIFAKASLAYKMKASVPKINTQGKVYLKNARHPLIHHSKIVPITVSLGEDYDSLVITGPNTGGKTVTLKTVGLLSLMTYCGMMIPVDDNSTVNVFSNILVDIGDEQSIEQSLSTFSSHMVNIIDIVNNSNANSLVLLDELGGGTDPVEGAALAKSILINLHRKGVKTVATTHYSQLKAYALDTPGVQNASFEFDVETLKPTYRLLMGIPGKSNAFSIAAALGMSESIIAEAKENISEDELRFERVVEALEKARKEADYERNEAAKIRLALAAEREKISSHLSEIEKKKELILSKTRDDAVRILENARYQSNQLLNSLEDIKKELNAQNAAENIAKAKMLAKSQIKDLENIADPIDENEKDENTLQRTPIIGDTVKILTLNRTATVSKVDQANGKVYVSSGNMNIWADFKDIKITEGDKHNNEKLSRKVTGVKSRAQRNISGEIDIRGMSCDEGILVVDRYIDEAVLSGIETIRIIHGKGTGVLRSGIQSHLRKHPNIDGFRVGTFGEGENGVTIATIKK